MYKAKLIFFAKLVVIIMLIYSIAVGTYFILFYEPFEIVSGMEAVSDILRRYHYDDLKMIMILIFIVCIPIGSIVTGLITPIIEVRAKVISREDERFIRVNPRGGGASIVDIYELTFQLEDEDRISFSVSRKDYVFAIGEKNGTLKYREGFRKRFVSFEVQDDISLERYRR